MHSFKEEQQNKDCKFYKNGYNYKCKQERNNLFFKKRAPQRVKRSKKQLGIQLGKTYRFLALIRTLRVFTIFCK